MSIILLVVLELLSPQQSRELVKQYNKVQMLIESQNYQDATRVLTSLVREFGSSEFGDEINFALGECYFNQGDYNRALKQFEAVLVRPQYSYIKPEAMYGVGLCYIMMGNYRKAQMTLEKLAKEPGYNTDPRTNFALGVLYYFQQSYEQARVNLEGLEMPEAKFYLGKCYARLGNPMQALVKFKEVTDAVPSTPLALLAHFNSGLALFINRDYDGARAKFQFFIDRFSFSPLSDFAHYFLGCALIAQKDYGLAIDHLMPLTRSNDNFIAAHANYFIGYAYMALGRPQEAVERFQRVRANYPRTMVSSYAHLQLAAAMLATADTVQTLLATSQLSQMFTTGALSGVGNYLSGVICYQLGDYRRAADQFEKILTNYAGTALREPAAAMFLMALNSSGQFDNCVALGTKYLADYPDEKSDWRPRVLYSVAEGFYYTQKYSEADDYYQRVYTHTAGSELAPYARLGRYYALYHSGRLNEALQGFKGLLNARLGDTLFTISAYLGYGYCLFNQGEYLKALDVFEALTNTFPDDSLATVPGYFYAGYCYYQMKYYGQAVDAWTTLINRFPLNNLKIAEAAFRTGDTYFKALEYDKALAAFNFVIEKYPLSQFAPPSQALIAQCYYNRHQYVEAIREYQKFLDLYPSDAQVPGVRSSLEMSYYFAGQEDSSIMSEFLNRFPQSEMAAEAQYAKGKELFNADRFDEAIVELQKTVVNFPGSQVAGDAQLLTAESYAKLKRWPEAAQVYHKFLNYFPEHEQRGGAFFNMGVAYFNAGEYKLALKAFQTVVDSFGDSDYLESAQKNIEICNKRLGMGQYAPSSEEREGDSSIGSPLPIDVNPSTEGEKKQ
ncbi:MAG: tetratricopeptide repeat protein [Candidatus Aminicenantales bacterium]